MRVTTTVIANAFQFLFLAHARLSSAGLLVVLPLLAHLTGGPGHAVAQLVEALRYKPEGRGFDSRWCYWNFSLI